MKVLVTGSRNWTDEDVIRQGLVDLGPDIDLVIHGGCEGADRIADKVARSMGIHTARVNALWPIYGKRAGPIRNRAMLCLKPDIVLAFPLKNSIGTYDMIEQSNNYGVTPYIWEEP